MLPDLNKMLMTNDDDIYNALYKTTTRRNLREYVQSGLP